MDAAAADNVGKVRKRKSNFDVLPSDLPIDAPSLSFQSTKIIASISQISECSVHDEKFKERLEKALNKNFDLHHKVRLLND